MKEQVKQLACTVELAPGEKLALPAALVESIGPGRWIVTVRPWEGSEAVRRHDAFLNSYAPEDESLYDDLAR
jgi:hypothetical protein